MSKLVHPFRFSILQLLLITSLIALSAWAVANPSYWVAATVQDLATLTLIAAIIGACVTDGATRAFWLAYAATFHTYKSMHYFGFYSWTTSIGTRLGNSINAYDGELDPITTPLPDFAYIGIWGTATTVFVSLVAGYVCSGLYVLRKRRIIAAKQRVSE